jgi:hypothetical protein
MTDDLLDGLVAVFGPDAVFVIDENTVFPDDNETMAEQQRTDAAERSWEHEALDPAPEEDDDATR